MFFSYAQHHQYPDDPATADTCVRWQCVHAPLCLPDCGGLECGDDGCGGTCGACTVGEFCTDLVNGGTCEPDGTCLTDANCPWIMEPFARPQFCYAGVCYDGQDLNGRTEAGESGADAGPSPDQSPDQEDLDGDCFCDLDAAQVGLSLACVETSALPGTCPVLGVGDCDDTPSGWSRYPGATEVPGNNLDDDCDGFTPGD